MPKSSAAWLVISQRSAKSGKIGAMSNRVENASNDFEAA
jgi:hypothetical protein